MNCWDRRLLVFAKLWRRYLPEKKYLPQTLFWKQSEDFCMSICWQTGRCFFR